MPLVSVIVVNWNRRALLKEALESLTRQRFRDFEVLVIDNGSTDGSAELVRERFAHMRLIPLPANRGFSAGSNLGIRHAAGTYIALLNNDAVAHPDWLQALVAAIERHPEVGSCASRIRLAERPDRLHSTGIVYVAVGAAIDRGWMMPDGPSFDHPDFPLGACAAAALYRKSMLEDIGLFDEEFSPAYLEDVDLSLRAQLRGYRCVYVPSALVTHRVAATLGHRSAASVYLGARNHSYLIMKDLPSRTLMKYGLAIALFAVLQGLFFVLRGRGLPYVLGRLAALRGLPVMLRTRREIQRRRSVSVREFEALLATAHPWSLVRTGSLTSLGRGMDGSRRARGARPVPAGSSYGTS